MNLTISDRSIREIYKFVERHGVQELVCAELKITIPLVGLSIVFFQPERYDESIVCYFDFGNDVAFFFGDVFSAIEGEKDAQQAIIKEHRINADTLKRNDDYIHHVLEYCEKNFDLLTSVPPCWFQRAARIADAATRETFPDLADDDMRRKQQLWESWRK